MRREISGFLAYIGTERGLPPKTIGAYIGMIWGNSASFRDFGTAQALFMLC